MFKLRLIVTCTLFLLLYKGTAQNINGVINSYAAVTNIVGSNISVGSAVGFSAGDRILIIQMKGASVVTANGATFGNITAAGGAGIYEFLDISGISGITISVASAPLNVYNFSTGSVQLVRVPKYCVPVVTSTITCPPWSTSTGTGGIIALEAGTLTLNSDINANAMGFRGGAFANSGFCCSNGNYLGTAGTTGGQKGESISAYIPGSDGLKGKQANGGGGGNCGNSGGGGGGNAGAGGFGGNQYSGCPVFDDRGIGGLGLLPALTTMFMGGGGGGGFRDNGQPCTAGGHGGGIIYIKANVIVCNNRTITSCGADVTLVINDEASGGGGGGGAVFLACNNFVGNLTVKTDGGYGGSNFNTIFGTQCHGPGGGGGGGVFAFGPASLPLGITATSNGGQSGTVNNPLSACFGTGGGATAGNNGVSLPGLPTNTLAFNVPTLTISQSNTICAGLSTTLTAGGANTYSWTSGPTSTAISVAPPTNSVYTLFGYNGTCSTNISHTVLVTPGPTVQIAGTSSICTGQSATIAATGNAAGYLWSTGATTGSITVNPVSTTIYTVTGTAFNCSTTVSHSVHVTITPTVAISGSYSVCNGQAAALTAASASNYTWSTGSNNASILVSPSVTSTYSVVGANGSCTVPAFHFINVVPVPTLNVTGATTLCSGTSVTINAAGAASYSWSTGSTSHSINASPTIVGTIMYNVSGTTNGCSAYYTHTLNVIPMPTVSISGNNHMCSGQTVTLTAFFASGYAWSTGSTASSITVSPPLSTTYSVIGANGACTVSAVKSISVTASPVVIASASSPSVCSGGTVQLSGSGANTYLWGTGSTNTVITVSPFITTTYSLYGSANNCTSLDLITINVIPTPSLYA